MTEVLEEKHHYGKHVHLLKSNYHFSLLSRFCSAETIQPQANQMVKELYQFLTVQAANFLFSLTKQKINTRMKTYHSEASFDANLVDPLTSVVIVDLMRAGILPTLVCFESLHNILNAEGIRQDHILLNRKVNDKGEVVGVQISGHKIDKPCDGAFVVIPDPMGATGNTVKATIDIYKNEIKTKPKKFIALHLMVTPEYLKNMEEVKDEIEIFTLRVDRGLSSQEVLVTELGSRWSEERGLNDKHYIVPGAGDVGHLLNNS